MQQPIYNIPYASSPHLRTWEEQRSSFPKASVRLCSTSPVPFSPRHCLPVTLYQFWADELIGLLAHQLIILNYPNQLFLGELTGDRVIRVQACLLTPCTLPQSPLEMWGCGERGIVLNLPMLTEGLKNRFIFIKPTDQAGYLLLDKFFPLPFFATCLPPSFSPSFLPAVLSIQRQHTSFPAYWSKRL